MCTRCGAPQATRRLRVFAIGIASVLSVGVFWMATSALQTAGVHHRADHDHTIGDWTDYDGDDNEPRGARPSLPSIFMTTSDPDAGAE
jgi:hypothetical protein